MNTNKTAGQIAYDSFWNLTGSDDQWIKSHRKEWERSAAAVIAHHEASALPLHIGWITEHHTTQSQGVIPPSNGESSQNGPSRHPLQDVRGTATAEALEREVVQRVQGMTTDEQAEVLSFIKAGKLSASTEAVQVWKCYGCGCVTEDANLYCPCRSEDWDEGMAVFEKRITLKKGANAGKPTSI